MRPKALLLLLLVFVLLMGAYLLAPQKRLPAGPAGGAWKSGQPVFKSFQAATASAVEIQKNGRSLSLAKKSDGVWVLASKDARRVRSDAIRDLLRGLETAAFVDARSGHAALFELDEVHGTRLAVTGAGGEPPLRITIGKSSEFGRCFVTGPAGPAEEVLEIEPNLEELCLVRTESDVRVLSPDLWYDLRILNFPPEDAVEIAIKKGHEVVRVQKMAPAAEPAPPRPPQGGEALREPRAAWWITEPEGLAADEQACLEIVNKAAHLVAQGYADDVAPSARGLDRPAAKTRIVLKDGTAHTLVLGQSVGDFAILQLEGRPEIWKVAKFNAEAFSKPLEKLKKEARAALPVQAHPSAPEQALPPPEVVKPSEKPLLPDPPAAQRVDPPRPPLFLPASPLGGDRPKVRSEGKSEGRGEKKAP